MSKLSEHLNENKMTGIYQRADGMDKDDYTLMRNSYYGIIDNLPNLVDVLKKAGDEAKPEYKIWKQILDLSNKSKLGKEL